MDSYMLKSALLMLAAGLALPMIAQASEGLGREATVHVRAVVALSPNGGPANGFQCSEAGDDRTPHTPRPLTPAETRHLGGSQGVALEDMWTSTGQSPVICELDGRPLLVVQPHRGRHPGVGFSPLPANGILEVRIEE
jgi:hypothetical protein